MEGLADNFLVSGFHAGRLLFQRVSTTLRRFLHSLLQFVQGFLLVCRQALVFQVLRYVKTANRMIKLQTE
jgi:hypothetical protein